MSTSDLPVSICIPIYPRATILDIVGPWQVFASLPATCAVRQYLVAATCDPVTTQEEITVVPDHDFATCPPFDVLLVPGGFGQLEAMEDPGYMEFLRTRGAQARYVAADCVGALLLACAGLLDGYEATTHWASLPCLRLFPKVKVAEGYPRYCVDGNRVTGGGVSSGIDEALELARILFGDEAAQQAQLLIQYAPDPPFRAGDPSTAPSPVVRKVSATLQPIIDRRMEQIKRLIETGECGSAQRERSGT